MLEEYQHTLGAEAGAGKNLLGAMLGKARDLADAARESDFLRLVGDIVMSRQAEDTFKTFRDGGRAFGNTQLAAIGETGERHHDEYNREANRLVQQMFIEHVRGVDPELARDAIDAGTAGAQAERPPDLVVRAPTQNPARSPDHPPMCIFSP